MRYLLLLLLASTSSAQVIRQTGVGSPKSRVRAQTSTAFVIPSGVQTVVNFNATTLDSLSEFNTTTASGTFTATYAGDYDVSMSVLTSVPALNTTIVTCNIFVNGSLFQQGPRFTQNSIPTNSGCAISTVITLTAGDTIKTTVFHSDSADLTLFADTQRNRLTIFRR